MTIADGDVAEAADVLKFKWTQTDSEPVTLVSGTKTQSVVFDDEFDTTPNIVLQVRSGSGSAVGATVLLTAKSTTGFTMRVDAATAVSISVAVEWTAVQP